MDRFSEPPAFDVTQDSYRVPLSDMDSTLPNRHPTPPMIYDVNYYRGADIIISGNQYFDSPGNRSDFHDTVYSDTPNPEIEGSTADVCGDHSSPFNTGMDDFSFFDTLKSDVFGEEITASDLHREIRVHNVTCGTSNAYAENDDPKDSPKEDSDQISSFLDGLKPSLADQATCSEKESDVSHIKFQKYSLRDVLKYLEGNGYPPECHDKGQKANFRKQALKSFKVESGVLFHKTHEGKTTTHGRDRDTFPEYARVAMSRKVQLDLVKMAHEGTESSLESTSLSAHRGIKTTIDVLARRVWWPNFTRDVQQYIASCIPCQQVNTAALKAQDPLRPVPPPHQILKQIGVDLITMPEVDGYRYAVIAIDYLSKYSHGKALKTKRASEVARFLFQWITLFGCPQIIINDQGREFVNEVSSELQTLTGVKQRVTRAYNPQANGQVERENQSVKCGLLKTLLNRIDQWPYVLDGVLFALRCKKQRSTNYSPYYMLFGREPIIPLDIVVSSLDDSQDEEEVDDVEIVDVSINAYIEKYSGSTDTSFLQEVEEFVNQYQTIKCRVLAKARENIKNAQDVQKKEFDKRHSTVQSLKLGDKVWKRNLRRDERKGDWHQGPWLGPYVIDAVVKGGFIVKNMKGHVLKKTVTAKNLKIVIERPTNVNPDCISEDESQITSQFQDSISLNHTNIREGSVGKDHTTPSKSVAQVANESYDCPNLCNAGVNLNCLDHTDNEPSNSAHQIQGKADAEVLSSDEEATVSSQPLLAEPREVSDQEIKNFVLMPEGTKIVSLFSIDICAKELSILNSSRWFNDEIINVYLKLISQRVPGVISLDSFIWPELQKGKSCWRSLSKVNVFEADILVVPVHKADHWALCVVDFKAKQIVYFDSLGTRDYNCPEANLKSITFPKVNWTCRQAENITRQTNTNDCGLFVCYYARRASQGKSCRDPAEKVQKMRQLIIREICSGRLLEETYLLEILTKEGIHQPPRALYTVHKEPYIFTKPGIGLLNNGTNTCFANAVLQVLFHCGKFIQWLDAENHQHAGDKCIICALKETSAACKAGRQLHFPKNFMNAVNVTWKDFVLGVQQDAQEFLSLLLLALHEQYLWVSGTKTEDIHVRCTAPIPQIFGGFLRTEISCPKCGTDSTTYSDFTSLTLPATKSSVEESLRSLCSPEQVLMSCTSCKENINAWKTISIEKGPEVLILHLQRFSQDERKITNRIRHPQHFMLQCAEGKERPYKLLGIVCHEGEDISKGHYISQVQINKKFYTFNDSKVSNSTLSKVLRNNDKSYLLFYI